MFANRLGTYKRNNHLWHRRLTKCFQKVMESIKVVVDDAGAHEMCKDDDKEKTLDLMPDGVSVLIDSAKLKEQLGPESKRKYLKPTKRPLLQAPFLRAKGLELLLIFVPQLNFIKDIVANCKLKPKLKVVRKLIDKHKALMQYLLALHGED
ncbi:hypothetical protein GOBAR_AA17858 [Gossypium barbadense]|uniref:Uncharacterized protein n=1 Tax=Gossypium barbadense TaxID=3634 RepID=A0A2P5XHH3_GOSBA|nr:hypothetical protein GOBAR_AA17858 [Gossypium barbadense]